MQCQMQCLFTEVDDLHKGKRGDAYSVHINIIQMQFSDGLHQENKLTWLRADCGGAEAVSGL